MQDQRYTSALLSHHYSTEFTQVPAKEILSLQAIYIARKHKHDPHQNVHRHQTSGSAQSLSLSLSNPSTAARPVTRRSGKTLEFDQASPLTHRENNQKKTYYLLPSSPLSKNNLPNLSSERRSLHPEASPLRSQTAILHNCITDPSHNSKPPHRLHTHSVQSSCRSFSAAPHSRNNNAPHAEVKKR